MTRDQAIQVVEDWNPDGPDLSDDVARWIAEDEGVQAAFEARFAHPGEIDPIVVPEGAQARVLSNVLDGVAVRQQRRGISWTTLGLLAAAGLSVVVLGALPMGAMFVAGGGDPMEPVLIPMTSTPSPDQNQPSPDAYKTLNTELEGKEWSPNSDSTKTDAPGDVVTHSATTKSRGEETGGGILKIIRGKRVGGTEEMWSDSKGLGHRGPIGQPSGVSRKSRSDNSQGRLDARITTTTASQGHDGQRTPSRVTVSRSKIEIRDRVHFTTGKAAVHPQSEPLLREIAQLLSDHPELEITVEGHTDSQGSAAYNLRLSQQRSESVRDRLVEMGISGARLHPVGFGEVRPVSSNETAEGRARNGRVDFQIVREDAPPPPPAHIVEPPSTERYTDYGHRDFTRVGVDPLSTFSVDVDTASYTLVRRRLREGYLPPVGSVRVEEFVNYFPYDYRPPRSDPFAVHFEATPSPFNARTHLVRVGVQGKKVAFDQRKSVHLTFLVDTSGSMSSDDKLGLVQSSLKTLTQELQDGDTVSIVAYAGSAGLVLAPTPMSQKNTILRAIDGLRSGGSTAMGQGIELAYRQAEVSLHEGAVNRVIICSDGDANVGPTNHAELSRLVKDHARNGITLTTLGFGNGTYNDTTMEQLANDGDGNYFYVDSRKEAKRIFVDKLTGTLQVIAKDVKLQVNWTNQVEAYRLIGYENRDLQDHEFRDDAVDAGEIGAGHQVTALYEVALAPGAAGRLATVHIRNKAPGRDAPASERTYDLSTSVVKSSLAEGSRPYRIAVASAYFAEMLRRSPHTHEAGYYDVLAIARGAQRPEYTEDAELIELMEIAARLTR